MPTLVRRAAILLFVALMLVQVAQTTAAQPQAAIQGPDTLGDQETGNYRITNPIGATLQIYSSSGVWIRAIVADSGVICTLDDGGTLDTIACDGSFNVVVSSDYGQQIRFVLADITKLVGAAGAYPQQSESDVYIFNGDVPAAASAAATTTTEPATLSNVLQGGSSNYRLTLLNLTSDVGRTFNIELSIPPEAQLVEPPAGCLRDGNIYKCVYYVAPKAWCYSTFKVEWPTAGIHKMWVRGLVDDAEVGYDERTGNVVEVTYMRIRQFVPIS